MAKKKMTKNRMVILIGALAAVFLVAALISGMHRTSPALPTPSPSRTPTAVEQGNAAKTQISESTAPTPKAGDTAKSSTAPQAGSANYIIRFSLDARSGGQFVDTELSSLAASGSCKIVFTPSSGDPVTQTSGIVANGNYLSCNFGGTIPVQGSGTVRLTVTGADGKTDVQDGKF